MMDQDNTIVEVVVVGGGLSGLSACSQLLKSGISVVLVEAANYLGGRVKQINAFEGWPSVDVGGEIIHGCNTITYRLALENNWETATLFDYSSDPEAQTEWIYLDGKLYPFGSTHADIKAADKAHSDFMYYYNNTQDTSEDISAAQYFDTHSEFSGKAVHIFKTIYCQTEAATLETYGSCEQGDFESLWPCGEGNYRMLDSQEQLVKYFVKECKDAKILLNWQAKKIDYTNISQIWMYTNINKETGDECHIVTGFQTADLAAQKAHLTADDVKGIFISDLDKIFESEETPKPASKYFIDFVYYHWSSNPFVRGAYSSPSVNARGSREILARPVRNIVYFAGEATRSVGDCCTVSGAIESGKETARHAIENWK